MALLVFPVTLDPFSAQPEIWVDEAAIFLYTSGLLGETIPKNGTNTVCTKSNRPVAHWWGTDSTL